MTNSKKVTASKSEISEKLSDNLKIETEKKYSRPKEVSIFQRKKEKVVEKIKFKVVYENGQIVDVKVSRSEEQTKRFIEFFKENIDLFLTLENNENEEI